MTFFPTTSTFSSAKFDLESEFKSVESNHEKEQEIQVNLYYNEEPVVEIDMEKRAIEIAKDINNFENRIAQNMQALAEQFQSKISPASKEEADDFLNKVLPGLVKDLISLLDIINFSQGYEKLTRTYPSTVEFSPFVEKVLTIRKAFNHFRSILSFKEKFDGQMNVFLKALQKKICTQVKESRLAQKQAILNGELIVDDKEFTLACIDGHLDACDSQPGYHWLELRSLLNLQQMGTHPRQRTDKELKMFMFLTLIYDRLMEQSN
jgi:hypothetical protein